MRCVHCGAAAEGRFCAACGAPMKALKCRGCSRRVPAGTRFCTHCGTAAGGQVPEAPIGVPSRGGPARGQAAGWWVSAGLLGALAIVVALSELSGGGGDPAGGSGLAAPTAGGAAAVDLGSMTSREAADALFDRVMRTFASGDSAQARTFLPMALDAHDLARPLDPDGLFHLSLLRRAATDYTGALEAALEGLDQNPRHLLDLSAAAEAARELGDVEGSLGYLRTMLDAWNVETAMGRPEYQHHAELLPIIRANAEELLGGPGP